MQINSNLQSLAARHSLTRSTRDVEQSVQRLSGGQRINGARDDGAGLAISERMTAGINGLNRAGKNINDGIALLQVADGAAGVIADNFQRIRELTVQAANGSNSGTDRGAIQQEVNALVASNYDIAEHTRYNSLNLLDGSFASQLQVGAGAGQTIALSIAPVLAPRGYGQALVDVAPQQATAVGSTVSGALVAGALLINGTAIGPSAAGSRPGQGSDSAFAVAAAINDAGVRDVAATASNSVASQVAVGGAMAAGDLVINGIDIGPIAGGTAAARAASAAAAIAALAGSSGVSASASGATLSLSTADGRNIEVAERGGGNAGSLGLTLGVHAGSKRQQYAGHPFQQSRHRRRQSSPGRLAQRGRAGRHGGPLGQRVARGAQRGRAGDRPGQFFRRDRRARLYRRQDRQHQHPARPARRHQQPARSGLSR